MESSVVNTGRTFWEKKKKQTDNPKDGTQSTELGAKSCQNNLQEGQSLDKQMAIWPTGWLWLLSPMNR